MADVTPAVHVAAGPAPASLVVRRIGRLLTMAGEDASDPTGVVSEAAVVITGGRVTWVGRDADLPVGVNAQELDAPELDAAGACVGPGFVDAHTHAVWAGTRTEEFAARMQGVRYDGGGIRTTVEATRAASEEELVALATARAVEMLAGGTTTAEVKSGYGLDPAHELRLLDVAAEVGRRTGLRVEPTYLGAHVVPSGRDRDDYVAEVVATIPAARDRGASWCDVFCDVGAFTVDEAQRILAAAAESGLGGRIHAEQLASSGGAALAATMGCASADHLEHVDARAARALAAAGVVGVLLPTAALSTRTSARPAAETLRTAGVMLGLGTDCNPGTSWCESMLLVVQLACLELGMSVGEAFRAATRGSAASLRRDDVGRVSPGAHGDLAVFDAAHEADVVAHLGARAVSRTVLAGSVVRAG